MCIAVYRSLYDYVDINVLRHQVKQTNSGGLAAQLIFVLKEFSLVSVLVQYDPVQISSELILN